MIGDRNVNQEFYIKIIFVHISTSAGFEDLTRIKNSERKENQQ